MKKNFNLIVLLIVLLLSSATAMAADDEALELLETKQEEEVLLNDEVNGFYNTEEQNISTTETTTGNEVSDNNEELIDNTELNFEIFKIFDKDHDNKIDEDTIIGKVLYSKITRTDIPTFLLQDDLTYRPQNGPVSKLQLFGAYQGNLTSIWNPDYSTDYNNVITQVGTYGRFRNHDYKFKLAFNPVPLKGINYVDSVFSDMYVLNTAIKNHQLIAGYSRVQVGFEGGASGYVLPFMTRSQIARNFGNTRSIALKVIGNYQYLDYSLSVGSSGRYIPSGMPGAEFNGWVNIKPFGNRAKKYGKFTIGAGYNGGHNRINYNVASAYIGYNRKKLWTNFEAAIADGYNGSRGISSNKSCGYAATLGWKFNPHLQLIGRVDQFDRNRKTSGDLTREYSIGLNWFIKGQALKMVLNYVFCDNQNLSNSHKIILGTQVIF